MNNRHNKTGNKWGTKRREYTYFIQKRKKTPIVVAQKAQWLPQIPKHFMMAEFTETRSEVTLTIYLILRS
jgi:hypothetical protein